MGFRTGAYATVWTVEPASDVRTTCRISISRKNKDTGEYDTEFSGYVSFLGTAAAKKAASLKEKDRIKLGDVDVRSKYDAEKKITYYNFNIFSFDVQEPMNYGGGYDGAQMGSPQPSVDSGELDDSRLPF